jgi:hypothetical protein
MPDPNPLGLFQLPERTADRLTVPGLEECALVNRETLFFVQPDLPPQELKNQYGFGRHLPRIQQPHGEGRDEILVDTRRGTPPPFCRAGDRGEDLLPLVLLFHLDPGREVTGRVYFLHLKDSPRERRRIDL